MIETTILQGGVAEWLKAPLSKSGRVLKALVSSNLTSSAGMTVLFLFSTVMPASLQAKKAPVLSLGAGTPYFSPNNDGVQDELILKPKAENIKSIANWEIQCKDASGVAKKTFSGTKNLPKKLAWDGRDDFNAPCAEGDYMVTFKVWDEKNRLVSAEPVKVVLDMTPPALSLYAPVKEVPYKGGLSVPVTFNFSAASRSGISNWNFKILDRNNGEIFIDNSTGSVPREKTYEMDPSRAGQGKLTALLYGVDLAGNKGASSPFEFEILKTGAENSPRTESKEPRTETALSQQGMPSAATVPFLQLTSILSLSDLFGNQADNRSSLLPQASIVLDPLAKALLDSPGSKAVILGHMDKKRSFQESKALSSYFAWRVFSYFVKQKGVDKKCIFVKGLGSSSPVADNRTPLGRARNRRIEVQIFFPQTDAGDGGR